MEKPLTRVCVCVWHANIHGLTHTNKLKHTLWATMRRPMSRNRNSAFIWMPSHWPCITATVRIVSYVHGTRLTYINICYIGQTMHKCRAIVPMNEFVIFCRTHIHREPRFCFVIIYYLLSIIVSSMQFDLFENKFASQRVVWPTFNVLLIIFCAIFVCATAGLQLYSPLLSKGMQRMPDLFIINRNQITHVTNFTDVNTKCQFIDIFSTND